jgi:hypothetical protein
MEVNLNQLMAINDGHQLRQSPALDARGPLKGYGSSCLCSLIRQSTEGFDVVQ